jgi:GNAT superfamily N-acetyltransferase
VARSTANVAGVILFYSIPSLLAGEDLCFLFGAVDPLYRRRGVGALLMTEVLATVSPPRGSLVLIAQVPDRDAKPAAAFLNRFGFVEIDCEVRYERNLKGIDLADTDPRFEFREYRGGDPSLDGIIVDLHRRAYRGHSCTADLTEELLASRLANPRCFYELLLHEKQLIGYASLWNNEGDCFVDSLLVARRYWRCGASDAIVHELERVALERGFATLWTFCSSSNAGVISLMNRLGCQAVRQIRRFCRRLGSDASSSQCGKAATKGELSQGSM